MARPVTVEEIEAAEELRSKDLKKSLELTQGMLERVDDDDVRMRLLFDVITCSTQLALENVTSWAIAELEKMPHPEFSRAIANMSRAYAEEQLGRPENALALHDMNLATGYFERDDFRMQKYELCLFKGQALAHLRRADEALEWLDKAHSLCPSEASARDETERRIFGWVEPNIQINRATCLLSLNRFDEAFDAASRVLQKDDGDLATLALQYMAECRAWQGRVEEALRIYADLKKRLPCRLVDESRTEKGIANCVSYLEKRRPSMKPS